ncbi:hypothetical protein D0T66_11540 [Dysgonomonas sp. 25]|nr:hypothetical protein [Dysgonomonas sp. 25]
MFIIAIQIKAQESNPAITFILEEVRNIDEYEKSDMARLSRTFADGVIYNKKRLSNFFLKRKAIGRFFENYLVKDSSVIKYIRGERIYQKDDETISENRIKAFYFKSGKLLYYQESFYKEEDGLSKEATYDIKYYISDDTLLWHAVEGSFDNDISKHFNKILKEKEKLIGDIESVE